MAKQKVYGFLDREVAVRLKSISQEYESPKKPQEIPVDDPEAWIIRVDIDGIDAAETITEDDEEILVPGRAVCDIYRIQDTAPNGTVYASPRLAREYVDGTDPLQPRSEYVFNLSESEIVEGYYFASREESSGRLIIHVSGSDVSEKVQLVKCVSDIEIGETGVFDIYRTPNDEDDDLEFPLVPDNYPVEDSGENLNALVRLRAYTANTFAYAIPVKIRDEDDEEGPIHYEILVIENAACADRNEIHKLGLIGTPTSGNITIADLSVNETSADIVFAFDSDNAEVKAAYEGHPEIDEVTVTGGPLPGTAVTIEFTGENVAATRILPGNEDHSALLGGLGNAGLGIIYYSLQAGFSEEE